MIVRLLLRDRARWMGWRRMRRKRRMRWRMRWMWRMRRKRRGKRRMEKMKKRKRMKEENGGRVGRVKTGLSSHVCCRRRYHCHCHLRSFFFFC